jgi:dienelactone hydrolase
MAVAIGLVAVVVVIGFGAAAIALFGDTGNANHGSPRRSTSTSSATSTTTRATTSTVQSTPPPTTSAAVSPLEIGALHAVGTRVATFVDSSRPTSPNGSFAGAPNRTLPTEFWYPAAGSPGDSAQPGATPDRDHGPYPLVLFAHGYDVTPDFYAPLLERWAAAGYVVAAPTFPILSGTPGGASHVDYVQTFGDASFVISQVLALPANDPLAGMVDPARIAVAGHSDGEVIAFALGFLECCRDARVKSVIAMAGDLANANNPSVRDSGTPILHIMETGDEYDPYPHSIQWDRDNLTAPRWMLTLNSTHVPPYTQPGDPAFELVSKATVDYLDGTLKAHGDRLDQITTDVLAAPAVGTLER